MIAGDLPQRPMARASCGDRPKIIAARLDLFEAENAMPSRMLARQE